MCDTVTFQLNTLGKLSGHIILEDAMQRFTLRRKPHPQYAAAPQELMQVCTFLPLPL
jgi:hypothetical protein